MSCEVQPCCLGPDWSLSGLNENGARTILSIQSLDYTKGIKQQLKAYQHFLEEFPQYKGLITLVLIVLPAVHFISEYKSLKEDIEITVTKVNSKVGGVHWSAIHYITRPFDISEIITLYRETDICLCMPLRDGINLRAKEFVASKHEMNRGVLILSEMSGSAEQMEDALVVNPNDRTETANAFFNAVQMSEDEQITKLRALQENVRLYDAHKWASMIMRGLQEAIDNNKTNKSFQLTNESILQEMVENFKRAHRRLLLLKYDGTLVALSRNPDDGSPDMWLKSNLRKLCSDPRNQVVVVSGTLTSTLNEWLGSEPNLDLAGEDGVWIRVEDVWNCAVNNTDYVDVEKWKEEVRELLEKLCSSTPGTRIEERAFALLWHYRGVERDSVNMRLRNFDSKLKRLAKKYDLQCVRGNNLIEIRPSSIKKGHAAIKWLRALNAKEAANAITGLQWDFILAIGDDSTDEDTFEVVNAADRTAYTVKVGGFGGGEHTAARFALSNVARVRCVIETLINSG
ncbi:hypothetical protein ACOME3_003187 [Neoechinorhynchus agilis]